ncbi:MAG: NAD-dependent epimerase/dehydratase family protein [Desulfovibrio sp.]|nr:NAD-dependent epimerase/dehydratase family protein [Desulfovibrio sp.]MBI4959180.1 NAD-dependent epimerase/dehydratase family protein [Desulfovibrio sp.]
MYFKNKRVLVAGGTGLIGIPLVELLLEQGAEVHIASLDDPARAHPDAEFTRADMMQPENCLSACKGKDFVFNMLGVKGSPKVTTTKPASFLVPTIGLAFNLLEATRKQGVGGYLYASSIAVYSPSEVMHEDEVWKSFPSPNDFYGGWAKRTGELHVEACRKEYGLENLTIVRPANVYGPFDNFDSQNAMVVPSLIRRALSGEPELTVWGDGSPVRDFIHARDVARCMLLVAEKAPQQPINIGSGEGVSIRQLVEVIVDQLDMKPKVVWDTSKPTGDAKRILDVARSRELGFTPRISLKEGVREVIEWYKANREAGDRRYDIFA